MAGPHASQARLGWQAVPSALTSWPLPLIIASPGLAPVQASLSIPVGSISWPRSYTDGCCSLGAAPSCLCASVMTSMS